jgi:hypothetical protein
VKPRAAPARRGLSIFWRNDDMASVKRETIKRPLDECACDWCDGPLLVGDAVFVDLDHGTAYCSVACAEHDHFDRGYGPLSLGVAHGAPEYLD